VSRKTHACRKSQRDRNAAQTRDWLRMNFQGANRIVHPPMYAESPDHRGENQRQDKRDRFGAEQFNLSSSFTDEAPHVTKANTAHLDRQAANATVAKRSTHVADVKSK